MAASYRQAGRPKGEAMSEEMSIHVLRLRGELGLDDCLKLAALLKGKQTLGKLRFILDLRRVTYINQAGTQALVRQGIAMQLDGGGIKLCAMPEQIRRLLMFYGYLYK